MEMYGLDLFDFEHRPVAGTCKHGHEPLGSIKYRKLLDHLMNCLFLVDFYT
jgi:hypothetical protein